MNLDRIKGRVHAVPFRPFIIETTGGTQIEVISPDYVMFAPEDRDLIVAFDRASRMFWSRWTKSPRFRLMLRNGLLP
jgi:hypothetical protein